MPFAGRSVAEERLRFVQAAAEGKRPITDLCREFGISRQCGYLWLRRYREGGAAEVFHGRSRKPLHSPRRTDSDIAAALIALRLRWPDWGANKLRRTLLDEHPHWPISRITVHRILLRHGLIHERDSHPPATGQFERSSPNELWQMDFKGPKGFRERTGPLSVLDDHSRYIVTLRHLENGRARTVRNCLEGTFQQHGVPEAMLMDHGTPWWNANSPWGWTELTVWLMRQGVRILLSGCRHPQTQGKVERMHGALHRAIRRRHANADEQSWLDAFREEYNFVRPHEALGLETPASRWRRSQREYQAEPKPWEYAATQQVVQVSDKGRVRWRGATFELSLALKGQLVGVEPIGENGLVYFCATPVSELHCATGQATAVPVDPFRSLQR